CFFFSSRRRHTRWPRDWSSDVCSSDLAVESGASIGFLPPLAPGEADAYWRTVVAALRQDTRVLLVARDAAGAVVGSAQLELAVRPNARHRAEVAKVMVHTQARRQGIGR